MSVNAALPDLIVDSVIISLINRSMVTLDDFIFSSNGCTLKKAPTRLLGMLMPDE